mgnify:CR=1 FL=1
MAYPEQSTPPLPTRPFAWLPRFRFSLKWLFVAVTVVALLLALSVLLGDFFQIVFFGVIFCVLPTPLVICALFGRRDVQAFAVGALVPWVTLFFWVWSASVLSVILSLIFLPGVCGIVAVATRRWLSHIGQ